MTKEELKQEAEEWINKWELCNKCDHKVQCIEDNAMCPQVVERAYLVSAEPREKQIAELEAEVKEWKDKADLWCKTANLKDHNIMINKELEKENAELKKQLEMSNKVYNDNLDYSHHIEEQLTKAKEILKRFVELENCTLDYDDIKEAEQFLNSEVE